MVFSPLAGGFLAGKYRDGISGRLDAVPLPLLDADRGAGLLAVMDGIAGVHGIPLATIALAWLRRQPAVTSVILGPKSVGQRDDRLAACTVALSPRKLDEQAEASALPVEDPG